MKVGIPKEIADGETRVAVIPGMVGVLTKMGHDVLVQAEAGLAASFPDTAYTEAGARIITGAQGLYGEADVILKVQPPIAEKKEPEMLKEGSHLISFLAPLQNRQMVETLVSRNITAFSMEFVPRITRAQSMDALSSMATIAGYKAVLLGANHLGKLFPLLMTAAGTISPANVLVLGAGVAGLQAIATAKRLGATVEAFDPRPAVKEQVESLGARFIEMEMPEDAEAEGGYAKELSDAFLKKEQEAIAARLAKTDVVITTAQVFGKKAPVLITAEMTALMKKGSVIVDLAAGQGGNCAYTEPDKVIDKDGVIIHGTVNLPAELPVHASQMYSKNITNLFRHLYKEESFDFEDEITNGACITHDGAIVNERVSDGFKSGGDKK